MNPPSASLRHEIRRLERLQEEEPGGLAFARLGEAYRAAGRHELALEVLEEGIREGPSHPAGHLVMARVHHDLDDRVRERRALEKALEVDPGNRVARRAMEELDAGYGSEGKDREQAQAGTPAGQDRSEMQGEAGPESEERRHASHSPEEHEELLAQLHRVSREDWWEEGQDDGDSAEQSGDDDDDEVVTETMGHLYARQGLWEEAETVYRRLSRAAPDQERLSRCLEKVRQREVPEPPPGRSPEQRPPAEAPAERSGSASEEGSHETPTMRAHLQALLRGEGVRPARDGSAPGRKIVGRREERQDDDDTGMDELLRRWRRAARKEDGQ